MQPLSNVSAGVTCTIKWMFGLPELIHDYFETIHVTQGSQLQIVQNNGGFLIIRTGNRRIGIDRDTAFKIKVA